MLDLDIIMSKFTFRKSHKGYRVLHLAIQEATRLYPQEFSMEQLCTRLMEPVGAENAKSVQRTLNRTVESIWNCKDNHKLFHKIYQYPVQEKPSAKDFIVSCVEYSVQQKKLLQESDSLLLYPTPSPGIFITSEGYRCTLNYLDEKSPVDLEIDTRKGE